MKLAFLGTGQYAALVLQQLVAVHSIKIVITQPPKPAGKKLKLTPSPVETTATANKLHVCHNLDIAQIKKHNPTAIIVCDYGVMIPAAILNSTAVPILNIHPSLLPRWRGAAPIERALLAGDKTTGVCLMKVILRLDAGDILHQSQPLNIAPEHDYDKLRDELAISGSALLLEYLQSPSSYPPIPQDERAACYAAKITSDDKQLDFSQNAFLVARQVQAFAYKPGAYCYIAGLRIKILKAKAVPDNNGAAVGVLLKATKSDLLIACGQGALSIQLLQRPSKNAMQTEPFLIGFPLQHQLGQCIIDTA